MYKLTQQPQPCKVSPKEAEAFLEINTFQGQRGLLNSKARLYADLLLQGKLRPVEIAVATLPNGERVLVNGQHVCTACVIAGREMNAVITRYKCETDRDTWELYATFDVHASRTVGQIFQGARGLLSREELRNAPFRILQTASTALLALQTEVPNFNFSCSKGARVAVVDDHADEVIWLNRMVTARHMERVGCVAAMLATHRKNPSEANAFWEKVASGVNFKSQNEPQKKCFDFLVLNKTTSNSRLSHEKIYSVLVVWWNTFRTGESRTSVKFASMKEIPAIVA